MGMFRQLTNSLELKKKKRRRRTFGQGITEYACILAFVALLVALTFGTTKGQLMPALSAAFSSVASELNLLSKGGGTAS